MAIVYDGFVQVERDERGYETVRTRNKGSVAFLICVTPYAQVPYPYRTRFDRYDGNVILITQPRPPMVSPEHPDGAVIDVPGERLDKQNLTIRQHVVEGAREEVGVRIGDDDLVAILNDQRPLAASPGLLTERTYLAYAEVRPDAVAEGQEEFGLRQEGERIKRLVVPVREFCKMPCETMAAWGLQQWFLRYLYSDDLVGCFD
ncbi:hypothetical protein HYW67_02985 [Candidatus Parcubacteria bacterium]|nr:hypothetical protein [Candidatus Parcubacteria bacterium]